MTKKLGFLTTSLTESLIGVITKLTLSSELISALISLLIRMRLIHTLVLEQIFHGKDPRYGQSE